MALLPALSVWHYKSVHENHKTDQKRENYISFYKKEYYKISLFFSLILQCYTEEMGNILYFLMHLG